MQYHKIDTNIKLTCIYVDGRMHLTNFNFMKKNRQRYTVFPLPLSEVLQKISDRVYIICV